MALTILPGKSTSVLTDLITDCFTTPSHAIGTKYQDSTGNIWIYVFNNTGSAFAAGDVLMAAADGSYSVAKATAARGARLVAGVAQHAIADQKYGWIKRTTLSGSVKLDGTTGATAGNLLRIGAVTAGSAEGHTSVDRDSFGRALATGAAGATILASFDCQG